MLGFQKNSSTQKGNTQMNLQKEALTDTYLSMMSIHQIT